MLAPCCGIKARQLWPPQVSDPFLYVLRKSIWLLQFALLQEYAWAEPKQELETRLGSLFLCLSHKHRLGLSLWSSGFKQRPWESSFISSSPPSTLSFEMRDKTALVCPKSQLYYEMILRAVTGLETGIFSILMAADDCKTMRKWKRIIVYDSSCTDVWTCVLYL